MKEIDKFITLLVNLQPVEFMGLARVLKVRLYTDEETREPREFEDVFAEVLERFNKCNRTRRREIIRLIKAVLRSTDNASNT